MDILVISENKLPQFIEEFFNHKKINFFIARGSIHCQSILNTKKIQRIFFFYTSSTQKIEKELIQVINQKNQLENFSFTYLFNLYRRILKLLHNSSITKTN